MKAYCKKHFVAAISVLSILIITLLACTVLFHKNSTPIQYTSMEQFMNDKYPDAEYEPAFPDMYYCEYNKDMRNISDLIVLVNPIDKLTYDNSTIIKDVSPVTKASYRKVEIKKVFKGNFEEGDIVTVLEYCYCSEDGKLYLLPDCYPLSMGQSYLMFLIKSSFPDEPYVAQSLYQGKVDLANLRLNIRADIAAQAVVDLLTPAIPENVKEAFLNANVIYPINDFYLAKTESLSKLWTDEMEKIMPIDEFNKTLKSSISNSNNELESSVRKEKLDRIEEIYNLMNKNLLTKMSAYKWNDVNIGGEYISPGMEIILSYVYDKEDSAWYFAVDGKSFKYYYRSDELLSINALLDIEMVAIVIENLLPVIEAKS